LSFWGLLKYLNLLQLHKQNSFNVPSGFDIFSGFNIPIAYFWDISTKLNDDVTSSLGTATLNIILGNHDAPGR